MKKKLLTVMAMGVGLGIWGAEAHGSDFKDLEVKSFDRVWSEWSEDKRELKIYAEAGYPNSCSVDKEIHKIKNIEADQIDYRIYRSVDREKQCFKIYMPTEKIYLIDQILAEELDQVTAITINGQVL